MAEDLKRWAGACVSAAQGCAEDEERLLLDMAGRLLDVAYAAESKIVAVRPASTC